MYKNNLKNELSEFKESYLSKNGIKKNIAAIKNTLETTSAEIYAGAIFGLFSVGVYQGQVESKREDFIPLAFSEISQVEKNIKSTNDKVGTISTYSMKVNDLCMKIFEAYNESHGYTPYNNDKSDIFGARLYECITLQHIYKYNLKDLLRQVPGDVSLLHNTFESYKGVNKKLVPIISDLKNTRDDSHYDNYHTEMRSRTTTDSKGKSSTKYYTVQVYDNTTHTYDYNKKIGEKVSHSLGRMLNKYPTLHIQEKISKTDKTNSFGELASDKSRQRLSDRLSPEELLEIANSRYSGSSLLDNIKNIDMIYPDLLQNINMRGVEKNTAQSDRYTNTSRSDSGPKEFQTINRLLNISNELDNNIQDILLIVDQTSKKISLLHNKIDIYIKEGYSHHKTSDEKAEEIMDITKEIYLLNFKNGVDIERFRWGMVFLMALLGGAIGAGLLGILDYADSKHKLYNKIYRLTPKNKQ